MQRSRPKISGFTLIELLVVISIIALLIGILLPALGAARRTARQLQNSTQLRGIQQGMVTFARSNSSGGGTGYFPGLDSQGQALATSETTEDAIKTDDDFQAGNSGIATDTRFAIMLNQDVFTPQYAINPADPFTPAEAQASGTNGKLDAGAKDPHYSYALLNIKEKYGGGFVTPTAGQAERRAEWADTINTQAVVASDRLNDNSGDPDDGAADGKTGANPTGDFSSPWTANDSKEWRGTMTRNDNSTGFQTTISAKNTQYGTGATAKYDNIFEGSTSTGSLDDNGYAEMIFQDPS